MSAGQRYYRPELDALRSFAFFSVFVFHLKDYVHFDWAHHPWIERMQDSGSFGLPLFFFLSAFLIVELLQREREKTGTVHVRSFYVRRILRIWPLYFLVATALTVVAHTHPHFGSRDPLAWLAFAFFAGNWYIVTHWWIAGPFDPLWSISVEEQFYLTAPWLAKLGGRKALTGISLVLLPLAYAVIVHYWRRPYPTGPDSMWTNSFFEFQFFAGGALLSLGLRGRTPRWKLPVRLAVALLALGMWFGAGSMVSSYAQPPAHLLQAWLGWAMVLCGCGLLILSALGTPCEQVPRLLVYLGRISYGAYLFHTTVLFVMYFWAQQHLQRIFGSWTQTACGVLTLLIVAGLASFSYRFYEGPFLRLKRRFTFVPSRPE